MFGTACASFGNILLLESPCPSVPPSVTEKDRIVLANAYMMHPCAMHLCAMHPCAMHHDATVRGSERPKGVKGVKDVIKQAQRAAT